MSNGVRSTRKLENMRTRSSLPQRSQVPVASTFMVLKKMDTLALQPLHRNS